MDFNILHRFDRPNEAANFVCKFLFWNWTITTEREFSSQKYGKRNIYGDICIYFPTGSRNIQFRKSLSTQFVLKRTQSILPLDACFPHWTASTRCTLYIIQLIHHLKWETCWGCFMEFCTLEWLIHFAQFEVYILYFL